MRLRGCNPNACYPLVATIAHIFAGFWTFFLLTSRLKVRLITACRQYLPQLVLLVLLANLPDIDFLFGLATDANANALHRGFTHSLAAAFFVALAVSCVWRIAGSFWRSATLYFLAYGSHLLIDLCTGNKLGWNFTGYGVPLLWPWAKRFRSPLVLIVGVRHNDLPTLVSMENVHLCLYELITFGAVTTALLAVWVRQQKNRAMSHDRETEPRAVCNSNPIQ